MAKNQTLKHFNVDASKARCLRMRRRILEVSQSVPAVHIAPAFSCLEILDAIYFGMLRSENDTPNPDTFILSKGHGAMAQYAILEELGIITPEDLNQCGQPGGNLGMHPDYGQPGIEASTGSLGHGLPIALGMALADKVLNVDRNIYVVLSDGELQEGSNWEALMLAPSLGLVNIMAFVDSNDAVSLGNISSIHPNFYPLVEKLEAFGWEASAVDGHDQQAIVQAVEKRRGNAPSVVVARTVKGKGVSYMENEPIWHYRSPSAEEYQIALRELTV